MQTPERPSMGLVTSNQVGFNYLLMHAFHRLVERIDGPIDLVIRQSPEGNSRYYLWHNKGYVNGRSAIVVPRIIDVLPEDSLGGYETVYIELYENPSPDGTLMSADVVGEYSQAILPNDGKMCNQACFRIAAIVMAYLVHGEIATAF